MNSTGTFRPIITSDENWKKARADETSTLRTDAYEYLFHQHLPTMERLIARTLCTDSVKPGETVEIDATAQHPMLESIKVLIETLPKVTYGDKLVHSARWFRDVLEEFGCMENSGDLKMKFQTKLLADATEPEPMFTPAQRFIAMKGLCAQYLSKGVGYEKVVCTMLKQFKDNTMDAMACVDNVESLKKLLQERLAPHNYCRPTVEATTGQLDEAMKLFKDLNFSTSLMPLTHLEKYGGKVLKAATAGTTATTGAMDIWAARKNEGQQKKTKHNKAAGLAGRVAVPKFPDTIVELFERIEEFPGLEIQTTGQYQTHLTEYPETAREAFKWPHLWAFNNGWGPISEAKTVNGNFNIKPGFAKITAMQCDPKSVGRRVFFCLEGAQLPANRTVGNTCFPMFLATSHERRCRRAFEDLNNVAIKVPANPTHNDEEDFCLGIGASAKDEEQNVRELTFKTQNGKLFHIHKLK